MGLKNNSKRFYNFNKGLLTEKIVIKGYLLINKGTKNMKPC